MFEAVHQRSLCLHCARAVPAPWPAWLRPSLSGRPADTATPARFGRGCLTEAAVTGTPVPRHARAIPSCFRRRHLTESAAPTTPRPRNALTVWLKPFDSGRRRHALAAPRPRYARTVLGCVAATAARTRAEHTAEYRAAAAVGGFPVHTM